MELFAEKSIGTVLQIVEFVFSWYGNNCSHRRISRYSSYHNSAINFRDICDSFETGL